MTIEQTVEIPDDRRVYLEWPRSIPSGVKAKVEIIIPAAVTKSQRDSVSPPSAEIEDVRLLLQKEMSERGTAGVITAAGDGWEAHVRERYAEP
jgi:hypothetical protein